MGGNSNWTLNAQTTRRSSHTKNDGEIHARNK